MYGISLLLCLQCYVVYQPSDQAVAYRTAKKLAYSDADSPFYYQSNLCPMMFNYDKYCYKHSIPFTFLLLDHSCLAIRCSPPMLKTMKIILKKSSLLVTLPLCWVAHLPTAQAQMPTWGGAKDKINLLFNPSSPPVNQVQLQVFRQLPLELGALQEFPQSQPATAASQHRVELSQAIQQALQRRPEITRSVASLAGQSANIDTAKAQYYPQISGGISSADLTTGERGRQVYNLSASQVLYDFGKIKSSVDVEQAKLLQEQAETLLSIDELAFQTANAIVNVNRYQELVKIAQQQIQGLG